jgi:hypothetical protein
MIALITGALTEIAVVGAHCDDIAIGIARTGRRGRRRRIPR